MSTRASISSEAHRSPGARNLASLVAVLVLVPMALSACAWMFPPHPSGVTGFLTRSPVSWRAVVVLGLWTMCAVIIAATAINAGYAQRGFTSWSALSRQRFQLAACLVGAVGTGTVYWSVANGSISGLVDLFTSRDFSRFSEDFEYGAGLSSGRYAAVIAGGMAIAHLVRRDRLRLLDLASLAVLALTVLAGSRLSGLMAISVAAVVVLSSTPRPEVRKVGVLILAVAILALLVLANYARNAELYENIGVDDPIEMAALNAQAYLATPTQVTLAVSDAVMASEVSPSTNPSGVLATFMPPFVSKIVGGPLPPPGTQSLTYRYQGSVGFTKIYTTNGAFTDLLMLWGWWAVTGALVVLGGAMWLAGRLLHCGEAGAAVAGALLYGLTELWRIWLYSASSIAFIVLFGFIAATVASVAARRNRPGSTFATAPGSAQ